MRKDCLIFVSEKEKLDNVLDLAIKKRIHLFIVKNDKNQTIGIITLEDILEEILRKEIIDETDFDEM